MLQSIRMSTRGAVGMRASLSRSLLTSVLPRSVVAPSSTTFVRRKSCGIVGLPNVGKCWGRDTELRMYTGDVQLVQDIQVGDQLMGDDGTPRTVQVGSLTRGHTARDGPTAATYRITSHHAGSDAWTCNAEHILVLKFIERPGPVQAAGAAFSYSTLAVDAHSNTVVHRAMEFATLHAAQSSLEKALADWQPLVWEASVKEFLRCDPHVRQLAHMFRVDQQQKQRMASSIDLAMDAAADPNCAGFTLEKVAHADYYGFTLDGNGRCLLADGTVTHNSTLFNALTDTQLAEASNYPFCTIEPNTASVAVPDPLLQQLAAIAKTDKIIYNQVKIVDIAGIIKGASEGAGLGNKFLNNIRDVDVLLHVVRCFDDTNIVHVDGQTALNPIADIETIETELALADLQTIEKRIENAEKAKRKEVHLNPNLDRGALYKKLRAALNQGIPIVDLLLESEHERAEVATMQLITAKPIAYICNVDEASTQQHNKYTRLVFDAVQKRNEEPDRKLEDGITIRRVPRECLRVCSQLESEVQTLGEAGSEARQEFLSMNNLAEGSLHAVIRTSNKLLRTISYYTVGVQEARAWGISVGTNAQNAAGKIHSDLAKGFVCAEVIKPADFIQHKGEAGVKVQGLMKTQGKEYIVCDGDIMHFLSSGGKTKK